MIKDSNEFKQIIEYIPEKVYGFIFNDEDEIKTILEEGDTFNLEYAFYLALAKKLYSKLYTFEGVLNKTEELRYSKYHNKIVKKGLKLFEKQKKEEKEKKEKEELQKRQHQKYIEKKKKRDKKRKEYKNNEQINIIAQAIRLSKEGE